MRAATLFVIALLLPSPGTEAPQAPAAEHRHQVDQDGDKAMGEFLRFQIKDHETGDPLTVSPQKP